MQKRINPIIAYNLDSERLKETFFSPLKKKGSRKKKNTFKRKILFFIPLIIGVIVLLFLFLLKYELLILPRPSRDSKGDSLFKRGLVNLSISKDGFIQKIRAPLYFSISGENKTTLIFDFHQPLNLNKERLILFLKSYLVPLRIEAVARDINYFSNSLAPLVFKLSLPDSEAELFFDFKKVNAQNINLSQIKQLRLYFSYGKELVEKQKNKNWVLIKDLVLLY